MKSPPAELCVTGSLTGGSVSAASCMGPGTAALRLGRGAATCALAAAGVSAAAPTRLAPLRKLRRATSGEFRRFGMGALQAAASDSGMASAQIWFVWFGLGVLPCRQYQSSRADRVAALR